MEWHYPATRPAKLCLPASSSLHSTRTGLTSVTTPKDSESFSDHGVNSQYKYRREPGTGTARYPSDPYPTFRRPPGWPPKYFKETGPTHCDPTKTSTRSTLGKSLNEPVYPGGRSGALHKAGNTIPMAIIAETQTCLRLQISNDILDAEQALRIFDNAPLWGPKSFVTRFERLARLRKYSTPVGWNWVDSVLERFPALGGLKAHEQYQEHANGIAARLAGASTPRTETRSTRAVSEICSP